MGSRNDFSTIKLLTVIPMGRVTVKGKLPNVIMQSSQYMMNQTTAGIQPRIKVPTINRVVITACKIEARDELCRAQQGKLMKYLDVPRDNICAVIHALPPAQRTIVGVATLIRAEFRSCVLGQPARGRNRALTRASRYSVIKRSSLGRGGGGGAVGSENHGIALTRRAGNVVLRQRAPIRLVLAYDDENVTVD